MRNLMTELNHIIGTHAAIRVDGKVASQATVTTIRQSLHTCFRHLWQLGFRLERPTNLNQRHVKALCQYWHQERKALKTIQERLSRLRIFCGWIGKGKMVQSLPTYLPEVDPALLRVSRIAKSSKSWAANGLDVEKLLMNADALDTRLGLMLRMMLWFGLRRKEVLHLQPWKADEGTHVAIVESKGGRPRHIPIVEPGQRRVLDQVKAMVKPHEHLGWYVTARGDTATLKYNYSRYNKLVARLGLTRHDLGVTGHGGRAQFAENLAILKGVIPPTLGGTAGQVSKEKLATVKAQVSSALGHNREEVTASYCGSHGRLSCQSDPDHAKRALNLAIAHLSGADTLWPEPERIDDCLWLIGQLATIEVNVTLAQVHALWQRASQRYGQAWCAPRESEALMLLEAVTSNQSMDHHPDNSILQKE